MTVLQPLTCALCGAAQGTTKPGRGEFSLWTCSSCQHVSTIPQLGLTEIAAHYLESYYGNGNRRFSVFAERLIAWFRKRRADEIQRFVPRGHLLDVGCGRGLLPAMMRKRGWEVHGTEFTANAAFHAREHLNISVWVGDFQEYPPADARFDVVVLWHVLEHLREPLAAIGLCHKLLRPGGLLVIAVPNYESWQARIGGRDWFHLDIPRHYHHFRLRLLLRALTQSGFVGRKTSHFSLEQNPFGWLQSLLNRAGLHHNLLYEILKHETARVEPNPIARFPLQSLATLAILPPLAVLAGCLSLLECVFRRGGTVEIYATKIS